MGGKGDEPKKNGNWILKGLVVHWDHVTLPLRELGSQRGLRAEK